MRLSVGILAAVTFVLILSAHAHRLNQSMLHLSGDQFWNLNLQAILDQLDDIDDDRALAEDLRFVIWIARSAERRRRSVAVGIDDLRFHVDDLAPAAADCLVNAVVVSPNDIDRGAMHLDTALVKPDRPVAELRDQ